MPVEVMEFSDEFGQLTPARGGARLSVKRNVLQRRLR